MKRSLTTVAVLCLAMTGCGGSDDPSLDDHFISPKGDLVQAMILNTGPACTVGQSGTGIVFDDADHAHCVWTCGHDHNVQASVFQANFWRTPDMAWNVDIRADVYAHTTCQ